MIAETSLTALTHNDFSKFVLHPYGDAIRSRYQLLYDELITAENSLFSSLH